MGLKFKKFKAKLNWKTKETIPDVVCLRYHINSEFDEGLSPSPAVVPTTSSKPPGTNEVIKQKKVASKPPVQNLFESNTSTSTSITDVNASKLSNKTQENGNLTKNQNATAIPTEPAQPKGILKKSIADENIEDKNITSLKQPENSNNADSDEYRKSALIFMTENHDYTEPPQHDDNKEKEEELDITPNTTRLIELDSERSLNENQEELVELRKKDHQQINKSNLIKQEPSEEHRISTSSTESQHADSKTVRWRNTIVEIKLDDRPESQELVNEDADRRESIDDFKVHFVKHQNISATGMREEEESDVDESEPENNEVEVNTQYRSRGAYSSQAASIFFAGEEPEPTARVRNVSQQDDDGKDA